MTIQLEKQAITEAMVKELDRRFIRYRRENLDAYVAMKINVTQTVAVYYRKPKKTSITAHTLKNWVEAYLVHYEGADDDEG